VGTRGFVGFMVDGELKIQYNHWDSYPSQLGLRTLTWLRSRLADDPRKLKQEARNLVLVSENKPPVRHQLEHLADNGIVADVNVSTGADWYAVLRETQGDLEATLRGGFVLDAREFPLDSLFCEWGYMIVLEGDGVFDVYRGFQKSPPTSGVWAGNTHEASGYYLVQRVASWGLCDLPTDKDLLALDSESEE